MHAHPLVDVGVLALLGVPVCLRRRCNNNRLYRPAVRCSLCNGNNTVIVGWLGVSAELSNTKCGSRSYTCPKTGRPGKVRDTHKPTQLQPFYQQQTLINTDVCFTPFFLVKKPVPVLLVGPQLSIATGSITLNVLSMVASMRVSVLFLIGLVLASAVAADLPMAPLPRRLMAPIGYSNTNLAANTVRAQAQTSQVRPQSEYRRARNSGTWGVCDIIAQRALTSASAPLLLLLQAIEQAVNSGGSPGATRRAGVVGTTTSWAAGWYRQRVASPARMLLA